MKRLAATLALGMLVALLVGTGVANAAGNGVDSAVGHVTDVAGVTRIVQPQPPCPTPPFCPPPVPPIESNVTADLDFNAKSSFNGNNPSGWVRITFRDEDPNQVFKGEVTCLNVQGNFATLSGPITEARGGSTVTAGGQTFQPESFIITAIDSGKGSAFADASGFVLSSEPATDVTCTTQFTPISPVPDGDVVVNDALN